MDTTEPQAKTRTVYVILNPIAGTSKVEDIRQSLGDVFGERGWSYEVYETTGDDDVAQVARAACQRRVDLVVAAGGDGTVAGVINGMLHTAIPLGILPAGTGNGLARSLLIPLDQPAALRLLVEDHEEIDIDAMQVGDEYYVLNVSAGISPRAMRDTPPEQKRRFGMLAYAWTILRKLFGYEPRRYRLEIDGHTVEVRAAEILVSNSALLTGPPYPLGPRESLSDGQLEAYLILAQTIGDYLRLLWNTLLRPQKRKPELRRFPVKERIVIDAVSRPQPVQADGELIGHTPVEVRLVPAALRVVVPPSQPASSSKEGS